jgi:hypothetical protein
MILLLIVATALNRAFITIRYALFTDLSLLMCSSGDRNAIEGAVLVI